MQKKAWKGVLALFCCFWVLSGALTVQAEGTIKHSTVNYDAAFQDATQIYIGNEKAVDWKVGDKYFLHYTVMEVTEDNTNQSGILVTKDRNLDFPYLEGGMYYGTDISLCEKGWTYLFRFEVTKTGLKYIAGKAKGTESAYIQFPYTAGEIQTQAPYFGVWITGTGGESLTAKLRNIRCYDEYGNDLGVYAPKAMQIETSDMNALDVDHSYSFSVTEAPVLAFGNEKPTASGVILLEYTVSNVQALNVTQSGAELTNAPTAYYPHGDDMGYLNYEFNNEDNPTKLLTEGASYLVRCERGKDTFHIMVRRIMPNGAVDYFSYANYYGKYNKDYKYFAMWLGQESKITADFTNVKCYDDKGNNLAIQTNQGVEVTHVGELEDYTQCIASYYCREKDTIIALQDEGLAVKKIVGTGTETRGTYFIKQGTLNVTIDGETQQFEYAYKQFRDAERLKYIRLSEKKVTFMSHSVNGEVIATVAVNESTGYKLEKPENPTEGNGRFLGWVDGAGKAFDFDTILTESKTLYATWDGEQKWNVMDDFKEDNVGVAYIVSGVVCFLLIGGTIVTSILYVRKRQGYEKKR